VDNPAGLCVDDMPALAWVPDRTDNGDTLHLIIPGALPRPAGPANATRVSAGRPE